MKCSICGREIRERSDSDVLYCAHCHGVFHRTCIMEHFYYHRFCPVCKKEISFLDLHYGAPPVRMSPSFAEPVPTRSVPTRIRRPYFPPQEEIPFFEIRKKYVSRKKGILTQLRGFVRNDPEKMSGALKRFRQNRKGTIGLSMLLAAVVIAGLAPVLVLYDPVTHLSEEEYVNHPPTWKYPLGTDVFGRDIYSQTMWGFRSALMIGLPSALLVGLIGTAVGLVSGYYRGFVDAVLKRISMTFLVWPSVPLVALIVYSWGPYQALPAVIIGVASTLWPTSARAIRAEVMSLKTRAFIEAAKVSGTSSRRIVFRHILPSVIHITFLYMTIAVASALALEATFNFLGLTSPAVVTWGQMLSFSYHASSARYGVGGLMAWWTVLPPALAIAYTVLSFFLISTGLRESMRITSVKF